jgi:hypothetical protein
MPIVVVVSHTHIAMEANCHVDATPVVEDVALDQGLKGGLVVEVALVVGVRVSWERPIVAQQTAVNDCRHCT